MSLALAFAIIICGNIGRLYFYFPTQMYSKLIHKTNLIFGLFHLDNSVATVPVNKTVPFKNDILGIDVGDMDDQSQRVSNLNSVTI